MIAKLPWSRITLASSALSPLLLTAVHAHENHDHSKPTTAESDSEASAADTPPAALPTTDPANSSTPHEGTQPVETWQIAQPNAPATQAERLGPNAISLGEPLLALIIAGPFLLIALKKRLQS